MKRWKSIIKGKPACLLAVLLAGFCLTGCGGAGFMSSGKRIVRIAHGQSEEHPEHLGLLAFQEYVEERLGDQYEVQIYPNEILGAAQKAVELTQTGAIDFVVAGTANLETFDRRYEIFSMPYLFLSEEQYQSFMNDRSYMEAVYEGTRESGLQVMTWYHAGTRNFYGKKPIRTPEDLKGMKIRVQQSPASVAMVKAFGAAASPMGFGEVYTAIQQGVIDGAENNELALTNNKHGEVAKYFSYDMHQMIPDMLIGNRRFLEGLTQEEFQVFQEAAIRSTEVELKAWEKAVKASKAVAEEEMGVTFIPVDTGLFQEKVQGLQQEMIEKNPEIQPIYRRVMMARQRWESEPVTDGTWQVGGRERREKR